MDCAQPDDDVHLTPLQQFLLITISIYTAAFQPKLYLSNGQFFYLFFTKASTKNVLQSKVDLIVRHVSYNFAARGIKPHFHATSGFLLESEYFRQFDSC